MSIYSKGVVEQLVGSPDCKSGPFGACRFDPYLHHKNNFFLPRSKSIFAQWIRIKRSLTYWKNKVCRVGQGVKTPPFHGGITGSNPVRGTERWKTTEVQPLGI